MIRVLLTLLLSVGVASAQVPMTGAGLGTPTNAPLIYTGPNDVIGGWVAYYALRAFSSATRGNKLVNACNSTGGVDVGCGDLLSNATTGALVTATISGITCPGANCTVKTWYDLTGNGNDQTQATVANRATLDSSCIGSLPCATGQSTTNTIYSSIASALSLPVPWTHTGVVFVPSGSSSAFQDIIDQNNGSVFNSTWFQQSINSLSASCGTAQTVSVTLGNWFAHTFTCNGGSSNIEVNQVSSSVSAGSNALTSSGYTYNLIRHMGAGAHFVEGGTNSNGLTSGQASTLQGNQRSYWGF